MSTAVERQRRYYTENSARMSNLSAMEVEHAHAISLLAGLAGQYGWKSFLDVGAGSGRGIVRLRSLLPGARILGIEPVEALRREGHAGGVSEAELVAGDALSLPFADGSFDAIYATGVLHHLPEPRRAIREMLRVASCAVVLSDLNNYGCGSLPQRMFAHSLRFLRLWKPFQWMKNGGRHDKCNDGDGVFYSYSLFDEIAWCRKEKYTTLVFTTRPTRGNPFWDASHVALVILKPPALVAGQPSANEIEPLA